MGDFEEVVCSAGTVEADSLVTVGRSLQSVRGEYRLPACFASDGVIWGVLAVRCENEWRVFHRSDLMGLSAEGREKIVAYFAEGVDGGKRHPRVRCESSPVSHAYWQGALAFLPDGRACRRLGRPLYRLSTAQGSFLSVDMVLSSDPAIEGSVMTSFALDQEKELLDFVGALSAHRRGAIEMPVTGDWPRPVKPTGSKDYLDRVRLAIIKEFPHEGLKLLPTDAVAAYIDLLYTDTPEGVAEAILSIGSSVGVDASAPLKAGKMHAGDWNRPLDRVRAIFDLPFRRVVKFDMAFPADIDDEDLVAAVGRQGVLD